MLNTISLQIQTPWRYTWVWATSSHLSWNPNFNLDFNEIIEACRSATKLTLYIVDIRYLECLLSQTFTISNFFFGLFSISRNFPYNFIWYLEPCYLELSLCQTNFLVPSALLSCYPELFHLDVQFLKKLVQQLWDSIECLSFCVHLWL